MKFDYSYRAFIITCLLFANLFLILYSAKLGDGFPVDESSYDIEYNDEFPLPEVTLAIPTQTHTSMPRFGLKSGFRAFGA